MLDMTRMMFVGLEILVDPDDMDDRSISTIGSDSSDESDSDDESQSDDDSFSNELLVPQKRFSPCNLRSSADLPSMRRHTHSGRPRLPKRSQPSLAKKSNLCSMPNFDLAKRSPRSPTRTTPVSSSAPTRLSPSRWESTVSMSMCSQRAVNEMPRRRKSKGGIELEADDGTPRKNESWKNHQDKKQDSSPRRVERNRSVHASDLNVLLGLGLKTTKVTAKGSNRRSKNPKARQVKANMFDRFTDDIFTTLASAAVHQEGNPTNYVPFAA